MKDLVSVVVPAYNAASKIKRCLDSICRQTYSDIEILVIDDGSVDGTADVVKKVAERDGRIRCITQENKGVAAARNKGLELARGNYIAFCDADDYVASDYIVLLLENRNEADWVIAGFSNVIQGKEYPFEEPYGETCVTGKAWEDFLEGWYKNPYIATVWGKLYKKQLIRENGVYFPEQTEQGEDTIFNIRYATVCDKVTFVNKVLYFYEEHEDSLTKKRRSDVWENQSNIFQEYCETVRKKGCSKKCSALFFARGILVALGHAAETKWESDAWKKLCDEIRQHTYFELCAKRKKEMDWFAKTVISLLDRKMNRCVKLFYGIKLFGYRYMQKIYYAFRR